MCFGSLNKINPFIIKYSQNQWLWNTLTTVSEIPYPHYDLWKNKADIVTLSFNNEWVLLVHWWQCQAAVEGSSTRSSLQSLKTVTDTRPTTNVGMRCSPDYGVHQLIKPFIDESPYLFHGRATHHYNLTAYLSAVSNELWPTLIFLLYVTPASQFCSAFFEHALFSAVTEP